MRIYGYAFGYRHQFALISASYAKLQIGMGIAGSLIRSNTLIYHRHTVFLGNSKSAEGNLVGVRPPSRHHLKYQYLWNQRLAALGKALCLGCFPVDPALRYEFRYSAHPLSFQYDGPLAADLISADYPYLRQITECAADLVPIKSSLWQRSSLHVP